MTASSASIRAKPAEALWRAASSLDANTTIRAPVPI
jgi:hypothetical protein